MSGAFAIRSLAALVLVVAVAPIPTGVAAGRRFEAVSPKLVGTWTRDVSSVDVKRAGAHAAAAGVWTLEIEKDGTAAVFDASGAGSFEGSISSLAANRVRVKADTPSAIYSWHVANRRLTFIKVKDSIPDRAAVFSGTWKHK